MFERDGPLSKTDFLVGMHRLIYCDEFQRLCLLMANSAKLRRQIHHFEENLLYEVRNLIADVGRSRSKNTNESGSAEYYDCDVWKPLTSSSAQVDDFRREVQDMQ